jgi:hypothetical protein
MDGTRFDDLAKTLAGAHSRRGLLKVAGAGLIALFTGTLRQEPANAQASCFADPTCSGHGHCYGFFGDCICNAGYTGSNCAS